MCGRSLDLDVSRHAKDIVRLFCQFPIIPSHPANPVVDASFTFQQSLFRFSSDLKLWSHASEVGSKIRKYYLGFGPSNCRLPGSLQLQHFLSRALEKMDSIWFDMILWIGNFFLLWQWWSQWWFQWWSWDSCVDVWNRTSWIFLTSVCQTIRDKESLKQIGEFCSLFFRRSWSGFIQDADVDEPLAENYVHVAVAVAQNLYADASGPLMYFDMNWFAFRQEVEESHFCCLAVGVGKSFVFWLCFHVDTQTCHLWFFCFQSQNDWGRSQQCTSQDKLCLFATWLEVLTIVAMVNDMRA